MLLGDLMAVAELGGGDRCGHLAADLAERGVARAEQVNSQDFMLLALASRLR